MAIKAIENFAAKGAAQIQEAALAAERPAAAAPLERGGGRLLQGKGVLVGEKNFSLTVDQELLRQHPFLRISDCEHFQIRGASSPLAPSHESKVFIELSGCRHFSIEGLRCASGRSMLGIADSAFFTIRDCECVEANGAGVIVFNSHDFSIAACRFECNLSAGVLVVGQSFGGEIKNCLCSSSRGIFNQDAGIHLCHVSPAITPAHIPENCHEALPISEKTWRPHHIVIKDCTISHCRAQGIYLEGALNCLIEENILLANNKEGICFDWGSSYNIFRRNIVSLNGERRALTPFEVEADFISEYPLLADGSSSMKLPGISLDNGCLNLLCENRIASNYGGGIKMIRTALGNEIRENHLFYNTIGVNEYVPHFHGITVLAIGAGKKEFQGARRQLLDFLPSVLNTMAGNTIREECEAIYCDPLAAGNFVADNRIFLARSQSRSSATTFIRAKAYAKRLFANLFRAGN